MPGILTHSPQEAHSREADNLTRRTSWTALSEGRWRAAVVTWSSARPEGF